MPDDDSSKARRGGVGAIGHAILPGLIGYNLRRAEAAMMQDFMRGLAALAITPGQFGVLVLIDANPGLNQTSLGNALGIDRSTVVSVIDRLEARGLVRRAPSANDRRSYALRLTGDGQALLAEAEPLVREHEDRIAADLSAEERDQLLSLLSRIRVD